MGNPAFEEEDGDLFIGTITATYFLNREGEPRVTVDRPGFDVIPAVVQLGIVALIQEQVMHGPQEDDDE